MPVAAMRPILRPSRSPNGEADRAPKKVPADRMETIRESSDAESLPSGEVENCFSQYGMARIPEMVPVS